MKKRHPGKTISFSKTSSFFEKYYPLLPILFLGLELAILGQNRLVALTEGIPSETLIADFSRQFKTTGAVLLFVLIRPIFKGKSKFVYNLLAFGGIVYLSTMMFDLTIIVPSPDSYAKIRFYYSLFLVFTLFVLSFGIFGSLRPSTEVLLLILIIANTASFFVAEFRGTPLVWSDIFAVNTAADVVDNYPLYYGYKLGKGFAFGVNAFILAGSLFPWKVRLKGRIASIVSFFLLYSGFSLSNPGRYYYAWIELSNSYVFAFFVNREMTSYKEPSNYTEENITRIIEQGKNSSILKKKAPDYDAKKAIDDTFWYLANDENETKPNIIAVMSESLADLTTYGIELSRDNMGYWRQLQEESISGNLYVDIYGAGTADSEYTFLTGNSLYFTPIGLRPYLLYVNQETPSLVSTLEDQGYLTEAYHLFSKTNWNRNNVYDNFGFDAFYGQELVTSGEQLVPYTNFVRDDRTYQVMLDSLYNKGDEPLFCFDVTMQNHGFYPAARAENPIDIVGTNNKYINAEYYLSLVDLSDDALFELTEQLRYFDEPTIICIFGDHQPKTVDHFFYEMTNVMSPEASMEERIHQYETPFMIWANYDLPTVHFDKMSVNYLSTLLLEAAGLETTPYNQYLAWLYEKLPVITRGGIITNTGLVTEPKELPDSYGKLLQEYKDVLYNNLLDEKGRFDPLYSVPGK